MPSRLNQKSAFVPVSTEEVRGWFGSGKSKPSDVQCLLIAEYLTDLGQRRQNPPNVVESHTRVVESFNDRWWDFKKTAEAANALLEAMPKMLQFSERIAWAPESADHHRDLTALQESLSRALHFIEYPFGGYEKVSSHAHKTSKDWHDLAAAIASAILRATNTKSEEAKLSRGSTLPRVVSLALNRLGLGEHEVSAISQFLGRRRGQHGLPGV